MTDESAGPQASEPAPSPPAPAPAGPTDDQIIGMLVGTETKDAGGVMKAVADLVGGNEFSRQEASTRLHEQPPREQSAGN